MSNSLSKYLLIFLGSVSLCIGVLGMFLPLLPSTCFFLFSAYCYVRSSPKLYRWLLHHRVFGPYIYNFITYKAITPRARNYSIAGMWVTMLLSALFVRKLWIAALLVVIGSGVSLYLIRLQTLTPELIQKTRAEQA